VRFRMPVSSSEEPHPSKLAVRRLVSRYRSESAPSAGNHALVAPPARHEYSEHTTAVRQRSWGTLDSVPTTEQLHALPIPLSEEGSAAQKLFFGLYGGLRKCLDYRYHAYYRKERQWLHDAIIEDSLLLQEAETEINIASESDIRWRRPNAVGSDRLWMILVVGVHGVGKHYVIQELMQSQRLRLLSYVAVDCDDLRTYLPEYTNYASKYPDLVDELTQKEAGYIAETLIMATLQQGRNALFFCNPRNLDWYTNILVPKLQQLYEGLHTGVIHITADPKVVFTRSIRYSLESGGPMKGVVQDDVIHNNHMGTSEDVIAVIPDAANRLKSNVDHFYTIENNGDQLQLLDGATWEQFTHTFDQNQPPLDDVLTPLKPCRTTSHQVSVSGGDRFHLRRRSSTAVFGLNFLQSSEDNHKSDDMKFYGAFADIRATLDYTYHKNYTFERQRFQDAIIQEYLNDAIIKDENGEICTTPTQPWIVFTAGAMGAGKGYTLKKLVEEGRFPLMAFVRVDPDAIRRYLPEFELYVQHSPERAGELTNKEAGYIAEILTLAGLQAGKNVIVDGSLRRVKWYG
jgi:Zeta toxin